MRLLIIGFILLSFNVSAGKVTIEKRDSLIRNDLFEAKRERAKEYKEREKELRDRNEEWSTNLDASCGLWKNQSLIYVPVTVITKVIKLISMLSIERFLKKK
ncbi:MAG TPA: hypothetical protein EYH12_00445 [Psychromonas hadalis]|nr:hypothetical protein [Psychromonas hadalis]